ncbi:hypothetical protein T10_8745, partial [Trichinella papuae]
LCLDLFKISLQWHRPLKAVLAYALALRSGGIYYPIQTAVTLVLSIFFYMLWLVLLKIWLQWHRPLKAVLAYAFALRRGRGGLDLKLRVLINVAWRR